MKKYSFYRIGIILRREEKLRGVFLNLRKMQRVPFKTVRSEGIRTISAPIEKFVEREEICF